MPKDVRVHGIDEAIYRRVKEAAAMEGTTMGKAVSDALAIWMREKGASDDELDYRLNLEFVQGRLKKEFEALGGKAVVVSRGAIQGTFDSLDEAKQFSRGKFSLALTFVVDERPEDEPLAIGLDAAA